jgi:hypothetical protein
LNSGSVARAKVAVVATDEPQMAPKAVQAPISAMPRPPRRWPIRLAAAVNSLVDSPERSAIAPIRMKRGMTDNV